MFQVLEKVPLEKFQLQKKGMGYAKVIHTKKRERREKWTQKCPIY